MLDSNTILGIEATLGCEEYSHAILTQSQGNLRCGTPVIYPTDFNLTNHRNKVPIATIISPFVGYQVGSAMVPVQTVQPINIKPLCGNHEVLTVASFDFGKFYRLLDFIHDVGGISLVIEQARGRSTIVESIIKLTKIFKYNSLFYYNTWGKKYLAGDDDKYICILSFFDIPYCIPLFDMRRVDGIGLSFTGVTLKASKAYGQLHRVFKADLIYSNYEENLYVIDGVNVNPPSRCGSDTYSSLATVANIELLIQKDNKDFKSKKKSTRGYINVSSIEENGSVYFDTPSVVEADSEPEVANDSYINWGNTTGLVTLADGVLQENYSLEFQPSQHQVLNGENQAGWSVEPSQTQPSEEVSNWSTGIFPGETTPEEEPDDAPDDPGNNE
jgi:hypothetical protein